MVLDCVLVELESEPFWYRTTTATTTQTIVVTTHSWSSSSGQAYVAFSYVETPEERFAQELARWLATYNLWEMMSRATRRAVFLARRLREDFVVRDVRPHRRACSGATRWMVTR